MDVNRRILWKKETGMGRFCTNCGEPLKEGAKFCGNCGEAVGEVADRRSAGLERRPYRPEQPRKLQGEVRRAVQPQQQSSGSGFWHFLAGTALGGFLGNMFSSSAEAHYDTVINHNENIVNNFDDDDEWEDQDSETGFENLEYGEEDDDYDSDYYDDSDYDSDYDDGYDGGDSDGFFDDFGGGDDFGGDDF